MGGFFREFVISYNDSLQSQKTHVRRRHLVVIIPTRHYLSSHERNYVFYNQFIRPNFLLLTYRFGSKIEGPSGGNKKRWGLQATLTHLTDHQHR